MKTPGKAVLGPPVEVDALVEARPVARQEAVTSEGARLLDRALQTMADARWLEATVVQQAHDAGGGYRSQSRLCLGPNDCARVETRIQIGPTMAELAVISDGRVLAEIRRQPGAADQVVGVPLPGANDAAARAQMLRKHGCATPRVVLAELRDLVPTWDMQPHVLDGRPAIRLDGTIDAGHAKLSGRSALPARHCRLFLDANSLWPMRLEWRRHDAARGDQVVLEIDYRDLVVNRPLSHAECALRFSYRAERSAP